MALRQIELDPRHVSYGYCHSKLKRNGACLAGSSRWEKCEFRCWYAIAEGVTLIARGTHETSGTIFDSETGHGIAGKSVSLIMPDGRRFRTKTNRLGNFRIVVPPTPKAKVSKPSYRVRTDFGRIASAQDIPEIVMLMEFTDSFRRSFPEVRITRHSVAGFKGKTITC